MGHAIRSSDHCETGWNLILSKAVARRCFIKKVFLKISQHSQKRTCARVSFLITLQANTFFKEHFWWLLQYCLMINTDILLNCRAVRYQCHRWSYTLNDICFDVSFVVPMIQETFCNKSLSSQNKSCIWLRNFKVE